MWPLSASVVVLAATENVIVLFVLLTVIAENPSGLIIEPIVKLLISLFPAETFNVLENETGLTIVPFVAVENI